MTPKKIAVYIVLALVVLHCLGLLAMGVSAMSKARQTVTAPLGMLFSFFQIILGGAMGFVAYLLYNEELPTSFLVLGVSGVLMLFFTSPWMAMVVFAMALVVKAADMGTIPD